jgi:acyl-coenzyme A synthetase/AMP-(fatty) acid ligase
MSMSLPLSYHQPNFINMTYEQAYRQSIDQPEIFWKEQARALDWFTFPEEILSKDEKGFYRWFKGGKLNTSYLALDYHVENGRADQKALIYDSPVTGVKKSFTYRELRDEVAKVAGALKGLGVEKGDRVIIYLPMVPEAVFAMLACARIGAIHSVVFGGFAPRELAIRIDDAQPKVLLTATGGIEISKKIPYEGIVHEALEMAEHKIKHTVFLHRPEIPLENHKEDYLNWSEWVAAAEPAGYVEVEATDPLYILYTSGTTGTPKGVIRDNGGHAVALKYSMKYVYDTQPGEVYWAASDVGWVVGHSYIVYAPLINGSTTILFEGKPVRTPDPGTFWRVIQEYGVTTLFTAPTAIRAIKKEDPQGEFKKKYPTPSMKYLFLAGERCDVATYEWAKELLGIHVIDNWWQTESGWPMLSQMPGYGLVPVKPGSATRPVCGYNIQVLSPDNKELGPNEEGAICVKLPLPPSNLPTLWHDDKRFQESYLDPFPGYYFSGDGGYRDEDGYVFITGRMDDVINIAGHRLSTSTMEEIVAAHPAVAECAVFGIENKLKGHVPIGLVVLKEGEGITEEELKKELIQQVRKEVGGIASFKDVIMVQRLPKTRSGKILRRTMRDIADGKKYSMPSTIEDPNVLSEIEDYLKDHQVGNAFELTR